VNGFDAAASVVNPIVPSLALADKVAVYFPKVDHQRKLFVAYSIQIACDQAVDDTVALIVFDAAVVRLLLRMKVLDTPL
jgi:predicted glycosyltransferase